MNFLAPMAFWFAAAIPVVVVFYLLKRKRIVRLVSSTVLWRKYLAETQASSPFQRLRHHWLLWIQILLLALLVFALTRPFYASRTKEGRLLVMILDCSASMRSIDEPPSRFAAAHRQIHQWISSLKESDQMVLLTADATTQVKQSPTHNKAALRRALDACEPTDGPTRLAEAVKLAETLTQDQARAEIHLFSDGAAPDLGDVMLKSAPLTYHRLGQRADNVGIVALDVRANPDNNTQRALFTSLANFSTNQHRVELELSFEDQVVGVKSLTLAPRETSPQVFIAPQTKDGVFTVRLRIQDDLSSDNQAAIMSRLPRPTKILLVTPGNLLLQKALKVAPLVQLTVARDLTSPGKEFDIVVLDGVRPTVWPATSVLAIHVANTNWFESWVETPAPAIVDWKSTHPLLRFINLDNVEIQQSLSVKTPNWALSLVDSPQTSLVLLGELARQRILWIGFDLLQSNWPLRISFPIFMANAVEFLNPSTGNAGQLMVRAGESVRLDLPQPATNRLTATLILPDQTTQDLPVEPGARELVIGQTSRQGVYRVRLETNEMAFCVNLLDRVESDTTPRTELLLGKSVATPATGLRLANLEWWRWIAALGLLLALFEWWFYHRRTA